MKCEEQTKTRCPSKYRVIRANSTLIACCLSMFCIGQTAKYSTIAASMNQAQAEAHGAERAVTVADSVQMTRFGDPYYDAGGSAKGIVGKLSPNGEQFVVVLRKGNLQDNTNEYSLVLFKTAEAFRSPTPRVVVSMSSSSNRPAIQNVVWLNDNDTILFLGEHPGETSQLYAVQCSSKKLTQLTNHATSLTSFATTSSGNQIAYVAENQDLSLVNETVSRNGFNVTNERLSGLIRGTSGKGDDGEHGLFIKQFGNRPEIKATLAGGIDDYFDEHMMVLSPDGAHLLIQTTATHVPEMWSGYENQSLQTITHHPAKHAGQSQSAIPEYELIDTRTGTSTLLADAPFSPQGSEVVWSTDSKSVLVSNMYLPLNVDNPAEQTRRKAHTFLVEFKIPTRQFVIISDEDLRLLKWDARTNTVTCDVGRVESLEGKNTPKAFFRKNGETWSRVMGSEGPRTRLLPDIVLDENMNTPPRIFAVTADGRQKSLLVDMNPQFRDLAFAKVEEVSWKSPLGDEVRGGLYWPKDYMAGRKYPLVIQTHGWISNKFWMDGVFPTAFAAQPLAGKGVFVLQLGEEAAFHLMGTPKEAPSAMAAYESAIDYLDDRGLIDRNLVGIIGFSRTCYYVTHMLAFSKYRIAAAVIADGIDADYVQYVAFANTSNEWSAEIEALNGGVPFGNALYSWINRVSAFHMDQVHAPLRIQALGPVSLLSEWNWFSGLYGLGKPVDLIYLPDGAHILEKPWERMASQQGDVDWFCFWLKNEEDPDPAKAGQYKRWREMRGLNSSVVSSINTP